MQTEILQQINYEEYDNFVRNNYSSFYQSKKHILFLEEMLGIKPHFVKVKDNNEIVGILPFFIKNSKYGKVLNSLPFFGSYGGIIGNKEYGKKILDELNNFHLENDILSSVMISDPYIKNEKLYEESFLFSLKEPKITQMLDLNETTHEKLWNFLEKRVRTSIRKSEKLDVKIKKRTLDNDIINEFYNMHKNRMEKIGGKIKPDNLFSNVKKCFKVEQDYEVLSAEMNGENLAYLLVFYYNNSAVYYLPTFKPESKHTQSTSLLIWKSIKDALKRGIKYYNFGGTPSGLLSLYKFKKGWNCKDFSYNYYINCDFERIKDIEISQISKHYEFFYVFPFEKMNQKEKDIV